MRGAMPSFWSSMQGRESGSRSKTRVFESSDGLGVVRAREAVCGALR
jgi:hypothetical protein